MIASYVVSKGEGDSSKLLDAIPKALEDFVQKDYIEVRDMDKKVVIAVQKKINNVVHEENNTEEIESLKKSIALHEELFLQQRIEGKNSLRTEKLLKSFRERYDTLIKTKHFPDSGENRKKALQEIFSFYTRQSAYSVVRSTFDEVSQEVNFMKIGLFLKFVKDFSVPISQEQAKALFKRTGGKQITFPQFVELVEQVAEAVVTTKLKQFNISASEISKIATLKENFYIFLGLDDAEARKKLLVGFKQFPFSIKNPPSKPEGNYFVQPKKLTEKIMEQVKQIRREKSRESMQISEASSKLNLPQLTLHKAKSQIKPRQQSSLNYSELRKLSGMHKEAPHYNLQKLEKLSFREYFKVPDSVLSQDDLDDSEYDPDVREKLFKVPHPPREDYQISTPTIYYETY